MTVFQWQREVSDIREWGSDFPVVRRVFSGAFQSCRKHDTVQRRIVVDHSCCLLGQVKATCVDNLVIVVVASSTNERNVKRTIDQHAQTADVVASKASGS